MRPLAVKKSETLGVGEAAKPAFPGAAVITTLEAGVYEKTREFVNGGAHRGLNQVAVTWAI